VRALPCRLPAVDNLIVHETKIDSLYLLEFQFIGLTLTKIIFKLFKTSEKAKNLTKNFAKYCILPIFFNLVIFFSNLVILFENSNDF